MATKKKAAAKKAAAPKTAPKPKPAAAVRYRRRPPTYEATQVTATIDESVVSRWGGHRQLAAQTAAFVGVDVPGQGRARPGDYVLEGDDGTVLVVSAEEFSARFEEAS